MANTIKVYEFDRANGTGFCYVFARTIQPGDGGRIIVKMPVVSANKRGVNDIGWMASGDVTLSGTFANHPTEESLWQEIKDCDEINKVTSAILIRNNETRPVKIEMRVILN